MRVHAPSDQLKTYTSVFGCEVVGQKKNVDYVLNKCYGHLYKLEDTKKAHPLHSMRKKSHTHTVTWTQAETVLTDITWISSSSQLELEIHALSLNRFKEKGKIKTVNIYFDMTFCCLAIYAVCKFVCLQHFFLPRSSWARWVSFSYSSIFLCYLHKTFSTIAAAVRLFVAYVAVFGGCLLVASSSLNVFIIITSLLIYFFSYANFIASCLFN